MIGRPLERLTAFSVDHPWWVLGVTVLLTAAFTAQLAKAKTDTDPKHMLPATSPVRQYNDQVERDFALHPDVIVVGIVNDRGVLNPITLSRLLRLTEAIQEMPGVISRDVESLSTTDDIAARGDEIAVRRLLDHAPAAKAETDSLRKALLGNPLFVNRLIASDATATAIFAPIEPSANGKIIADQIRKLFPKDPGEDRFYLAGDPVARDTFGAEMFRQMGLFSPIAGLLMCLALWFMFRSLPLIGANMAVAMVSILWSMGLFVALGYPIHIMSSMAPVFLMAIATDSVHIFNEFAFRYGESWEKRRAILETMRVVGSPVLLSDLTTAAGFAALATATIVPVKIFGLLVAFGTLVILLMSFTLVPAVLSLLGEKQLPRVRPESGEEMRASSRLKRFGEFSVRHARVVLFASLLLSLLAGVGLLRIRVNNNLIHWFKAGSAVRTADREMNARLGGTSVGYLVIDGGAEDVMKNPAMLRGIEALQRELERDPLVGKTFSVVDYVKRINRELHGGTESYRAIPDSPAFVGQYLFLFSTAAKPTYLDNVVDYPFERANLILQLKSWDAGVMEGVIQRAQAYLKANPLPGGATIKPAGIAYFNLVWNHEVLWGMLDSFLMGLALVLLLLIIELRSFLWGILASLPLLLTIAIIYGAVGLIGKDFDMPVAVLSTLSLGLAVDFAIHFIARFRQRIGEGANPEEALVWTVARPGRGILLNAVLFAASFAVMIFSALTPYITVGFFMAAIMLLSALLTLLVLPGLILQFKRFLLKGDSP